MPQMGGTGNPCLKLKRLTTRKKGTKLNKRYEKRIKGVKLEEKVQNLKENIRDYKTKRLFQFCETTWNPFFLFSYFFSFAKWSKLSETVTCFVFRETKKIRNCQPYSSFRPMCRPPASTKITTFSRHYPYIWTNLGFHYYIGMWGSYS